MGVLQRVALNKEILEFDKSGQTRGKSFKYVSHPSDSPHHNDRKRGVRPLRRCGSGLCGRETTHM